MSYIQPSIYDSRLPTTFAARFPALQDVIAMKPLSKKVDVFYSIEQLNTVKGEQMTSFAKHKKFKKGIFADFQINFPGFCLIPAFLF